MSIFIFLIKIDCRPFVMKTKMNRDEKQPNGLIHTILEREDNQGKEYRCPAYDYVYKEQLERQIRRVKEEEKRTDELLTLGLIRKMLEREGNIRK